LIGRFVTRNQVTTAAVHAKDLLELGGLLIVPKLLLLHGQLLHVKSTNLVHHVHAFVDISVHFGTTVSLKVDFRGDVIHKVVASGRHFETGN